MSQPIFVLHLGTCQKARSGRTTMRGKSSQTCSSPKTFLFLHFSLRGRVRLFLLIFLIKFLYSVIDQASLRSLLTAHAPAIESTKHFQTKSMRLIYEPRVRECARQSNRAAHICVLAAAKWRFFYAFLIFLFVRVGYYFSLLLFHSFDAMLG